MERMATIRYMSVLHAPSQRGYSIWHRHIVPVSSNVTHSTSTWSLHGKRPLGWSPKQQEQGRTSKGQFFQCHEIPESTRWVSGERRRPQREVLLGPRLLRERGLTRTQRIPIRRVQIPYSVGQNLVPEDSSRHLGAEKRDSRFDPPGLSHHWLAGMGI